MHEAARADGRTGDLKPGQRHQQADGKDKLLDRVYQLRADDVAQRQANTGVHSRGDAQWRNEHARRNSQRAAHHHDRERDRQEARHQDGTLATRVQFGLCGLNTPRTETDVVAVMHHVLRSEPPHKHVQQARAKDCRNGQHHQRLPQRWVARPRLDADRDHEQVGRTGSGMPADLRKTIPATARRPCSLMKCVRSDQNEVHNPSMALTSGPTRVGSGLGDLGVICRRPRMRARRISSTSTAMEPATGTARRGPGDPAELGAPQDRQEDGNRVDRRRGTHDPGNNEVAFELLHREAEDRRDHAFRHTTSDEGDGDRRDGRDERPDEWNELTDERNETEQEREWDADDSQTNRE